jgi:hypothetical protein
MLCIAVRGKRPSWPAREGGRHWQTGSAGGNAEDFLGRRSTHPAGADLLPRLVALVGPLVCMLVVSAAVTAPAGAADRTGGGNASLADQLTTGLKVKAPTEVAFCEKVAELVQRGNLPEKYVDSAYTYAINRGRKYPFPAFERIIRLQASKLGVSL